MCKTKVWWGGVQACFHYVQKKTLIFVGRLHLYKARFTWVFLILIATTTFSFLIPFSAKYELSIFLELFRSFLNLGVDPTGGKHEL